MILNVSDLLLQEKIKKLVDIWEKGQTFPPSMIESFKQKLSTPALSMLLSTHIIPVVNVGDLTMDELNRGIDHSCRHTSSRPRSSRPAGLQWS